MGINLASARFLIAARDFGASYEQTLTIGRPFFRADLGQLNDLLYRQKPRLTLPDGFRLTAEDSFADRFFRVLGAQRLSALDASDYEGADILHDMNEPIGSDLRHKFTVVYDSGSLEHVFNFPVAIRNCMEMVAPGGHLILGSPANNWCGHGFYQFSPELYWRIMVPENGFALKKVVLKAVNDRYFYSASNPASARERVSLTNFAPTEVFVLAERINGATSLATAPVQLMYEQSWEGVSIAPGQSPLAKLLKSSRVERTLKSIHPSIYDYGNMLYHRYVKDSFRNRAFYTKERF